MQSHKSNLFLHVLEELASALCIQVRLLNVSHYTKLMQTLSEVCHLYYLQQAFEIWQGEMPGTKMGRLAYWNIYFSEIAIFLSSLVDIRGNCCGEGWECSVRSLHLPNTLGLAHGPSDFLFSSLSYPGEEGNGQRKSKRVTELHSHYPGVNAPSYTWLMVTASRNHTPVANVMYVLVFF